MYFHWQQLCYTVSCCCNHLYFYLTRITRLEESGVIDKWINAQFQVHTLPVCETLDPKAEAKQMEMKSLMGTLMLLVIGKYSFNVHKWSLTSYPGHPKQNWWVYQRWNRPAICWIECSASLCIILAQTIYFFISKLWTISFHSSSNQSSDMFIMYPSS